MARKEAALGFKAHTGWATAVAIVRSDAGLEVAAKQRIDVAAGTAEAAVFHAGKELSLAEAEALLRTSEAKFAHAARDAIARLVADLGAAGCKVVGSAVVSGSEKPLPPLASVLRSHALVHAAEGDLFRRLFAAASESCGVVARLVAAKELAACAAEALGISQADLATRLAALGKQSGRPWAQDHREATLAALSVLR
jgi:hypothetical protein